MKRRYLSPGEIAENLSLTDTTVRNWTRAALRTGRLIEGEDVLVLGSAKRTLLRIDLEAFKRAARVRRPGRPVEPLRQGG